MEVIPPGKYLVQIVNSEMKLTSTGGELLWLEFDILDGEHKGRKLFDRLNLQNSNAQAVEIAQRALSAICHATGQMQVNDSQQLHYKPMVATVKVQPAGPDRNGIQREAQNQIRGYEAAEGVRAGSYTPPKQSYQPPGQSTYTPSAQGAGAAPAKSAPWLRNKG
jgi:hypothetical protein